MLLPHTEDQIRRQGLEQIPVAEKKRRAHHPANIKKCRRLGTISRNHMGISRDTHLNGTQKQPGGDYVKSITEENSQNRVRWKIVMTSWTLKGYKGNKSLLL